MNLAEPYPPTLDLAATYSAHSAAMAVVPLFSRSFAYSQRALTITRDFGDVWGQAQSLHFYGVALHSAAQFESCVSKCQQAIDLFEKVGDYWEMNIARFLLAMSLCRLGRNEEAEVVAKEMYQSGIQLGDVQSTAMSLEPWVRASPSTLPIDMVQTEFERPRKDVLATANVVFAYAQLLMRRNRVSQAVEVLEKGAGMITQSGVVNAWVTPVFTCLATALQMEADNHPRGSTHEKRLLKRAMAASRRGLRHSRKFPAELPNALCTIAHLQARRGKKRRSALYLQEAISIAEHQNASAELNRLRHELRKLQQSASPSRG